MMWLLATLTAWAGQDETPQELDVTVLEVKGGVETKVPGKDKKWAKLEKGVTLQKGAMVQTGIKSHVLLQFGESTKVLVRPSTFAVINEAYLERNALRGDVRVDVGSVHVDAERGKDPNLEFKVTTPQGTAAVRGTRLGVRTSPEGLEAFSEKGITDINTIFGYEYKLGLHLSRLHSAIGSDLAKMAKGGRLPQLTHDSLKSLDDNQGEQSWSIQAFNPASQANEMGHRIHHDAICAPTASPIPIGTLVQWDCGLFAKWNCVWDSGNSLWLVIGTSPISSAFFDLGNNRYEMRVHGRVAMYLKNITGIDWEFQSTAGVPFYSWNGALQSLSAQ